MKRALCIGINYTGTPSELAGCVNDALAMQQLLKSRGYTCTMLLDDGSTPQPTRRNILKSIGELIANAQAGDRLVLQYAGHGSYTRDASGDESDGRDEVLCPVDNTSICDDELRAALIDPLCSGVSLLMVLDCCHSGTTADLRYSYDDTSRPRYRSRARLPDEYVPSAWVHRHRRRVNARNAETRADVVCFSGCRDTQTSADTVFDNRPCGAMTTAFTRAFAALSDSSQPVSVRDMLQYMTGMLRCYRYEQVPQLSVGSRALDRGFTANVLQLTL